MSRTSLKNTPARAIGELSQSQGTTTRLHPEVRREGETPDLREGAIAQGVAALFSLRFVMPRLQYLWYSFLGKPRGDEKIARNAGRDIFKRGSFWSELNVVQKCRAYQVSLWSCPQFLFIVMGVVIIIAILGTNAAAQRYTEPEVSALIVIGVTVFLLFIGHAIIGSFERVAEEVRAKSEFISIVSHELRNPLTSIGWQLDLLSKHKATGEAAEVMAAIRTESNKMLDLVNDMLLANRMEVHAFELRPEPFSLADLTREVIAEYELIAKKNDSKIILNVEDGLPTVYGDRRKIRMVVEHLIDNALKYGKNDQEVAVRIARRGTEILFGVTDQGVGIPVADQRYIFGKFFRAHNAQRYQIEGIGLGLYIVRNTVEKSGGRLGFESKEDEGSTFWFSLPVCVTKAECK